MDDDLIKECKRRAKRAWYWSLTITAACVTAFALFTLDWSITPHFSRTSDWKAGICIALFILCFFRLGMYGTFRRFVNAKAEKKPDSFFVLVKRHQDGLHDSAVQVDSAREDDFKRRVKDAIG